ncbi:hypothetical protein G6O67_003937 [Ophiocordyceps sinensis]|uniref:Uncharacterized protein n=1 Tax=Ophiocordyceps sinensis TaxID=72228 RepID=A0A8H4PSS9_9HYPO|nr:hypothetical protein G6O67_003937 [Ophiocordyceps sinensis]
MLYTPMVRLDSRLPPSRAHRALQADLLPRIVRQVSRGCLSGLTVGLVLGVFSRTAVFLGCLVAVVFHLASRIWNPGFQMPQAVAPEHPQRQRLYFTLSAFVHLYGMTRMRSY